MNKAKRAKNHVEEGLEKVRAKPWAEPLGKALEVTGKIVGAVDGFVPHRCQVGAGVAVAAGADRAYAGTAVGQLRRGGRGTLGTGRKSRGRQERAADAAVTSPPAPPSPSPPSCFGFMAGKNSTSLMLLN